VVFERGQKSRATVWLMNSLESPRDCSTNGQMSERVRVRVRALARSRDDDYDLRKNAYVKHLRLSGAP